MDSRAGLADAGERVPKRRYSALSGPKTHLSGRVPTAPHRSHVLRQYPHLRGGPPTSIATGAGGFRSSTSSSGFLPPRLDHSGNESLSSLILYRLRIMDPFCADAV